MADGGMMARLRGRDKRKKRDREKRYDTAWGIKSNIAVSKSVHEFPIDAGRCRA